MIRKHGNYVYDEYVRNHYGDTTMELTYSVWPYASKISRYTTDSFDTDSVQLYTSDPSSQINADIQDPNTWEERPVASVFSLMLLS